MLAALFEIILMVGVTVVFIAYNKSICHTHEIQGKSRELLGISSLGHSDLYLNNYWMSHVWYTPGGSGWRVSYPTSKDLKCTLTRSH